MTMNTTPITISADMQAFLPRILQGTPLFYAGFVKALDESGRQGERELLTLSADTLYLSNAKGDILRKIPIDMMSKIVNMDDSVAIIIPDEFDLWLTFEGNEATNFKNAVDASHSVRSEYFCKFEETIVTSTLRFEVEDSQETELLRQREAELLKAQQEEKQRRLELEAKLEQEIELNSELEARGRRIGQELLLKNELLECAQIDNHVFGNELQKKERELHELRQKHEQAIRQTEEEIEKFRLNEAQHLEESKRCEELQAALDEQRAAQQALYARGLVAEKELGMKVAELEFMKAETGWTKIELQNKEAEIEALRNERDCVQAQYATEMEALKKAALELAASQRSEHKKRMALKGRFQQQVELAAVLEAQKALAEEELKTMMEELHKIREDNGWTHQELDARMKEIAELRDQQEQLLALHEHDMKKSKAKIEKMREAHKKEHAKCVELEHLLECQGLVSETLLKKQEKIEEDLKVRMQELEEVEHQKMLAEEELRDKIKELSKLRERHEKISSRKIQEADQFTQREVQMAEANKEEHNKVIELEKQLAEQQAVSEIYSENAALAEEALQEQIAELERMTAEKGWTEQELDAKHAEVAALREERDKMKHRYEKQIAEMAEAEKKHRDSVVNLEAQLQKQRELNDALALERLNIERELKRSQDEKTMREKELQMYAEEVAKLLMEREQWEHQKQLDVQAAERRSAVTTPSMKDERSPAITPTRERMMAEEELQRQLLDLRAGLEQRRELEMEQQTVPREFAMSEQMRRRAQLAEIQFAAERDFQMMSGLPPMIVPPPPAPIMRVETKPPPAVDIEFHLKGTGFEKKHHLYHPDPYVEVFVAPTEKVSEMPPPNPKNPADAKWLKNPGTARRDWLMVYRTEQVKRDQNPNWKPFHITLEKLGGDVERKLHFDVYDFDKFGAHTFIGSCECTILQALASDGTLQMGIINQKKKEKKVAKGQKYFNSGVLHISSVQKFIPSPRKPASPNRLATSLGATLPMPATYPTPYIPGERSPTALRRMGDAIPENMPIYTANKHAPITLASTTPSKHIPINTTPSSTNTSVAESSVGPSVDDQFPLPPPIFVARA